MQRNTFYSFLILTFMVITMTRCTLDEGDPSSSAPALTLSATRNLSLIELHWAPVKVTGFKEYVLLQSPGNIPDAPTPTVNVDITVLTRINDVNVTSFLTTATPLTNSMCYKLYTSVDDRFLYSPTICVNQEQNSIPGFFDKVGHERTLSDIAMFDRLSSQLVAFNVETNTTTNSISETNLLFPILDVSIYQGAGRLIAFDQSTNTVRRYTFPQLTFQSQKFFGEVVMGGTVSEAFAYVVLQNATNGFQVYNASNFVLLDSEPSLSGTRNIAVFEGNPKTVLEIGDSGIKKYLINDQGKVIQSDQLVNGVSQVSIQSSCAYNDQYYIGGRFSTLVNKDGEIVQSLISGLNAFTQLCRFSEDGSKALLVVNNINAVSLEIIDMNALPSIITLKSFSLPSASFSDAFVRGNIAYVIGINFNSSSPQTFLLKFPI